jgi:NhaA family Na+:H+ antiporter
MTTEYDIDDVTDTRGADEALSTLARRIRAVRSRPAPNGPGVLTPPLSHSRDHVEGPQWAPSLVVFGSYGTPRSRPLGNLLQQLREANPASLRIAWRHLPDAEEHPRAVELALAAEAAATHSRFWSMNRELLAMRHDDFEDLHAAARLADVDFYRLLYCMSTGLGADRIVSDVESARASTVGSAPALFVNGERFSGDLDAPTVWAALHSAPPRLSHAQVTPGGAAERFR